MPGFDLELADELRRADALKTGPIIPGKRKTGDVLFPLSLFEPDNNSYGSIFEVSMESISFEGRPTHSGHHSQRLLQDRPQSQRDTSGSATTVKRHHGATLKAMFVPSKRNSQSTRPSAGNPAPMSFVSNHESQEYGRSSDDPVRSAPPPIQGASPPIQSAPPPIQGTSPPIQGAPPPIQGTSPSTHKMSIAQAVSSSSPAINLFDTLDLAEDKSGDKPLKTNTQPHSHGPDADSQPQPQNRTDRQWVDDLQVEAGLASALVAMGFSKAFWFQAEILLHARQARDVVCLAETGSGKTLSFVTSIVESLLRQPRREKGVVAAVISPTRELCLQINAYFEGLRRYGVKQATSVVLHGGVDPMDQVLALAKNPAILVATPGRLLEHLANTKGFALSQVRFLVFDEADKLLTREFEDQLTQVLAGLPQTRMTWLFSATISRKVQRLQKVSLKDPVMVETTVKYRTVSTLEQHYAFMPARLKDCYLVHVLHESRPARTFVFVRTRLAAQRLSIILGELGFKVQCLHGELSQAQRQKSIQKIEEGQAQILVCTDVASRGLDIPDVQRVINYDLCEPKAYIHRVGRTARQGREGHALSFVTQYNVEDFQRIESKLGFKLTEYAIPPRKPQVFLEKLEQCRQTVNWKMRHFHKGLTPM